LKKREETSKRKVWKFQGDHEEETHQYGQSEPAPSSATMWLDGALMGVPFSSLPIPGLTKLANSSCPFSFPFLSPGWFFFVWELFFSSPPVHAQVSHAYLTLCTLGPPSPTYLPICPPTHPSAYLCTYALNHHQGNDNVGR
jgi:hypothetical protein